MQAGKCFVAGSFFVLMVVGCAGEKPCARSAEDAHLTATAPAIPGFVLDALHSDGAKSVKIYLAKDGTVRKSAVYVTKESLPNWVHALADEKLGQGEDEEYEVEQYGDSHQVYEITRKVDGVSLELSVAVDKTLLYVEKKLAAKDLPEKVAAVLKEREGFTLDEAEAKTFPDGKMEYELEGKQGGFDVQLKVSADGEILSQGRMFTAKVTVDR